MFSRSIRTTGFWYYKRYKGEPLVGAAVLVKGTRGGTASILGPNAPGGIFNYVSKKGGQTFAGEVRTRVGLEGNGKNLYLRGDFNIGGPLSKDKSLTYNIGGFYRNPDGPKNSGYKLSYGGQIKANVIKQYKSGSLRVYAKLLDDNFNFLLLVLWI